MAAVGWYEQGVRFLDVAQPERHPPGRLLPARQRLDVGRVLGADRPDADIVYTADAYRGIDVLRIDARPTRRQPTVTAPILDEWFGGTPATYAPSEIWGFGCPTTNVAVA